jgi:hypothetical protein
VVEDHIEDDFEAGLVQPPHHGAKFLAHRRAAACGGISRLGAEEADRVVAPVVAQAEFVQTLLVQVLVHRQQAHGGDAERSQMRDGGVAREAGVGAAQRLGHARVLFRETAQVQFIEHGVVDRRWRGPGRPHRHRLVDDPCLQRPARVVAQVQAIGLRRIETEVFVAPLEAADDLARPGVEQQLVRIEAPGLVGRPAPVRAQTVDQAGACAGQAAVPDIAGARGKVDAADLTLARIVEQAEFDPFGMRREDRDVDALGSDRRAHRPGPTGRRVLSAVRRHARCRARIARSCGRRRRAPWRPR